MPDLTSSGEDDNLLIAAPSHRPREPLLDQSEIDLAMGFEAEAPRGVDGGARAMLGAGAMPRERMPMLPVVFDDAARRLSLGIRSEEEGAGRAAAAASGAPAPPKAGAKGRRPAP